MEKKKSPPIRSRSKKYDFETPLNPFEGESLKGIAAFIESSVTLQSPAPLASDATGGSQNQSYSEILPLADSSYLPHPTLAVSSAESEVVLSIPATDSMDIAAKIEIDTPNTPEEYLGDCRSEASITEPGSPTDDTSVMSTHVTQTPVPHDEAEIGILITRSENVGSSMRPAPFAQMTTDPHYEPNVEELSSPEEQLAKITYLSEHGDAEAQAVMSILESPAAASFENSAERDSSRPAIESLESVIIGTHISSVSSTPITQGSATKHESSLPGGGEKSSSVLGIHNSSVLSTPITSHSAENWEPDQHATEASQSAMLGTPNLRISSTHRNILYLKIHPAVRGQDGLNKGEEKIYTFLWRTTFRSKEMGKPEFRTEGNNIEISLRHLARKVGLGLANCAWHMHCLEEKGCIAKVKETDHYHPAVYYVREFGQILQWRREHGLTHFIQRGHLAAFVDPLNGIPITRFRGQTSTIYRGKSVSSTPTTFTKGVINTPGLSTPDTTYSVLNSQVPGAINSSTPGVIDSNTQLKELTGTESKAELHQTSTSHEAPSELITLLHNISPTMDHEAVVFLWNECCARVTDCTVEEVLYFTSAKAAILEPSKIRNPIGFLLAAVPKCFEGETFKVFRRDRARRQEETLRREAEEHSQAMRFEREAQREAETYRMAEERLAALSQDERNTLYEQIKTELRTKYPRLQWPDRQAHEDRIRLGMIRELQKQLLGAPQGTS